jgi:hypothetical protein
MVEFTITKIEAARRQLRMAIELWFADADPVPTHTLARAAYQIIHDLNRKQTGSELLLDGVKPERKSAVRAMLNEPSDFMKHADRGKVGALKSISFDPELSRGFIVGAVTGLRDLQQDLAEEEMAFELWHHFHHPQLVSEAGRQLFKNSFDVKAADALRSLSKDQFFKRVRDIIGRQQRGT